MPTLLPKTGVRITRITQNLSNPADSVVTTTTTIYEGLASCEDASGMSNVDIYFPSGSQEAKKYIVYCEPSWGVQTDDIVELNEDEIGDNKSYVPSSYSVQLKINTPKRFGALKILGTKHIEVFCYSSK